MTTTNETFLYLTTTGRKTGNPHTIEIWYVEYDDCYYLCAEHREKSDWVQNILANPHVTYYISERNQPTPAQNGTASILTDNTLLQTLHHKFQSKYNWNNGLFVQISNKE